MEFRVLGPLEVVTPGGPVPLTGPKRRALLALLLMNAGEALSGDRLADELWNGAPPRSVSTTLPTFVYQLRRRYGIEALQTTPAGYVLEAEPDSIDAHRFERLVADARARLVDEPAGAKAALQDALALWRGGAYSEFADEPWAKAEVARLEDCRVEAVEAWAIAAIGARDTSGVTGELETWTSKYPLRESLWALRMLALAHDARTAEALRVATNLRAVLGEELGVEPSAPFSAIETTLIRGDPAPAWPELGGFGVVGVPRASPPPERPPPPSEERRLFTQRNRPVRRARTTRPRIAPLGDDAFVGRSDELFVLDEALEDAAAGAPQVVLVIGDAGIGKSRLVDEFTPHAIGRGARVLTGACQEDVGVPYLPLATALAPVYAESGSPSPFESPGVLRIDEAISNEPIPLEDARLRLFLAATRVLLDAAETRTTILILEDVHWIDDATLALLRHLVAVVTEEAPSRSRLMVLMTTREPDPVSASATFLARLERAQSTNVVAIDALDAHQCHELVASWLGKRPARGILDRLVEASAGNPLVLRSAVTRLRESEPTSPDSAAIDLFGTTDLDQELWQRLDGVSAACEQMVLDAAFLGDGSRVELLAAVCDVDESTLDALIDEASEHQIMLTDGDQYWFDHPQLRQLVYHLPASRDRTARHLRVADRIAPHGADVLAVAHHLVRAGSGVDPQRILDVCGTAAERAVAIGAWREAARYSSLALDAAQSVHASEEDLAKMELRAGYAALLGGEREAGLSLLGAAADRAQECGELETWGRALAAVAREEAPTADLRSTNLRSIGRIDEFLAVVDQAYPALRAELYALKAELSFAMNDIAAARRHASVAEDLALQLHDDELRVKIAFARGLQQLGALDLADAKHTLESMSDLAERSTDPSTHIWCTSRLGLVSYTTGEFERAEKLLQKALELAHRVDLETEYGMAAAVMSSLALEQGRFAQAESNAERARRAYDEGEYAFTPIILYPTLAAARADRGDRDGAHRALDEWDVLQGRRSRRFRPLVDALVGDLDAARAALASPSFRLFTEAPRPDLVLCGAIAAQGELAALVDNPEFAAAPLEALIELYDRGMRFTIGWPAFIPRVIALATATLGDVRRADEWFDRALIDARAADSTTEIARTALDHARHLAAMAEPSSVVEDRLATARSAYQALSIRPRVPGAEGLDGRQSARPTERDPSDVTRVVLVTDLVSSTELNEALGDHDYVALLQRHDEIIRTRLAQCDGVEFKHTGDGIAAWFLAVNSALRCAVALEHDFEEKRRDLGMPLRVRVALTAGAPSVVGTDLLGVAVTLAFRVADLANPGDVLVTSEVAALARGLRWSFEPFGSHRLKGIATAVDVFKVR